jgi:CubicO group peptidase (beta-lactamase class C family)
MAEVDKMSEGEIIQDLNNYLEELFIEDEFSGAVLVANQGNVLYKKAYGLASKRYLIPNRTDTKFNLGSMNKMFTGVAVVQLAEKGLLDFQDKVGKYWPEYPNPEVAEKVSIHHLLTHTSGMGSYFNQQFVSAAKERYRQIIDYLPLFVDEPLRFEPGTRWEYSNSGFMLLGALIERISGQDYFDYVRDNIYIPAGMTNTDAYEMDDDSVHNLAMGYTRMTARAGKRINNIFLHSFKGGPAGGGFSTVEDLLRFDQALRQHNLLSTESLDTLLTNKVADLESEHRDYAYGFGDHRDYGTRVVGHGGGFPGINSKLDMYLDLGYTVAVMSNYDPNAAERVAARLRKRFTGTPLPRPIAIDPETLLAYEGVYEIQDAPEPGMVIKVTADRDHLLVRFPMGQSCFFPRSEDSFFDEETNDIDIQFQRDARGQVNGFTYFDRGMTIRTQRISQHPGD